MLWQGGHGAGREWQALKQVPLHTAAIRFMAAFHGVIYCGFSDGRARAYGGRLRLASWAEVRSNTMCQTPCRRGACSSDVHSIVRASCRCQKALP